jgi:hypothetical protein
MVVPATAAVIPATAGVILTTAMVIPARTGIAVAGARAAVVILTVPVDGRMVQDNRLRVNVDRRCGDGDIATNYGFSTTIAFRVRGNAEANRNVSCIQISCGYG